MSNQIGIVITGCKRDFGVICDNHIINLNDSNVHQALMDVRRHIVVHKPYVDFYSIEFLHRYMAITGYRSSKDLGRDGYIGITVFLSYSVRIPHVRNLLKELLDCYFRNYMNPLTWEPVTNKNVDIRLFDAIVNNYETVPNLDDEDIMMGAIYQTYDNESVLDDCLDNPFHVVPLSQKVYLLNKVILENASEYQLELHIPSINEKGKDSFNVKEIDSLSFEDKKDAENEDSEMPSIVKNESSDVKKSKKKQISQPSKQRIFHIAIAALLLLLLGFACYIVPQIGHSTEDEPMQVALADVNTDNVPRQSDVETTEERITEDSINDKESEEAEAALMLKEAHELNKRLDALDLTPKIASDVMNRAKELGDNKLVMRAQAYMTFFNATKIDDVKHNMKAFSPEQQRVCKQTYAFDTKLFHETKKRVGMSFKKAQDILKQTKNIER